jgi:hypothetical protein
MLFSPTIPAAILETVITGIATLFLAGANGDATVAREAARELLADYRPRTSAELSLAAIIISCGLRSLDILVQAAAKDLPVAQMLRLHASAVGLCREAAKAQRHLTQIQKEHIQTRPAETARIQPEPAPQPIHEPATRPLGPIAQFAKDRGLTWSKANQEREREKRIAASLQRAEAKVAAANAAAMQTPVTPTPVAPEPTSPAA